jgi:hypothetical protein
MGKKIISDSPEVLTEGQIKKKNNVDKILATGNKLPTGAGLYNSPVDGPNIGFAAPANAHIISKNNSFIVLGADMPEGMQSGYGGKGSSKSATIDLVVGRVASKNDGLGPKTGELLSNNFFSDAARIYISQMTDIDKNFAITESGIERSVGRSAVGIKADAVRVIGREGVKIVTGKGMNVGGFGENGETNSLGGQIKEPAPKIEFIAGNNSDGLQPLLLGDNTTDAMKELGELVEQIAGSVMNLGLMFTAFATAVGIDPGALGIAGVPVLPTAGATTSAMTVQKVIGSMVQVRANKVLWAVNYLEPLGSNYICSKNVSSN